MMSVVKKYRWKLLPLIELAFKICGKRWTHFYGWMLDYQERSNSLMAIIQKNSRDVDITKPCLSGLYDVSAGPIFIRFLKSEGLKSTDKFLDFGCGYGRVGIPVIEFLDADNYVGIDLSAERIRMANEYVELRSLEEKTPKFFVAKKDNSLDFCKTESFDFIWCFSVFAHMPLEDTKKCLQELEKLLKVGGVLITNYSCAEVQKRSNISAFWYTRDQMKEIVLDLNFQYEEISDWSTKIAPDRTSEVMLRLSKIS